MTSLAVLFCVLSHYSDTWMEYILARGGTYAGYDGGEGCNGGVVQHM